MAYELECGGFALTPLVLAGAGGTSVPLFVTGTDPNEGVVNMATEGADYVSSKLGPDGTFLICIESPAPIEVQLADGNDFTVTQTQADTYEGDWLPMKILKVYKAGSTGTFSVGR